MRVVIIFLLIIAIGFLGYRAAERYGLIGGGDGVEAASEGEETVAEAEQDGVAPPYFDIVRVDRSGEAVMAGGAAPRSEIVIFANGEELARVDAIANGDWTASVETPLSQGAVELTLLMITPDGLEIRSEDSIVIYVPERPGDAPLVLKTKPGGATEVLQRPDEGVGLGPLALDAIDYDDRGSVIFSGRATKDATVQVFADGQFVGQTVASEAGPRDQGRWSLAATVAPGRYLLQVYQLDEYGEPVYAIELPFERALPEDIDIRDGKVIVQPGNNLWRISRVAYGSGFQYTVIYEANADQIRDPDLIYPGQVFSLPEREGEDATDQ